MEKEKRKTSGKGWIDVGESGSITVSCNGNLVVKADAGATVRFSGANVSEASKENRIHSDGNLSVKVPLGVAVILERVSGNATVKGVTSTISASGDVSGNLTIKSSDNSVSIQSVYGNLVAKDVGGKVTVAGTISGNAQARNVGGFVATAIHGDLSARNMAGEVSAETVHGNVTVRQVTGNVTLKDVMGDCSVRDLSGTTDITCRDDIRIRGPLSVGKHTFNAGSTIDLYYPDGASLTLTATAPNIRHDLSFNTLTEKDGVLSAQTGSDGPMVTLTAADRIRIRPMGESGSDWDVYADIDFDFSEFGDIGERISAEINARMGDFTAQIGPEFSAKAEQALRKAQAAIERTVEKMESEMSRAESRAYRSPRPSRSPRAAPSEPKPDTTEAQLKILKMLEEGTISVEEANKLLAAIG